MKIRGALFGLISGLLMLAAGTLTTEAAQVVGKAEGRPAAGLDIMEVGSIGGIKLGATEAQVRAAAGGKPAKPVKGKDQIWGADGAAHQEWIFPESGLEFDMASAKIGGPKTASSITVKAPSNLKTGRGIRIGSPKADVIKAYAGFYTDPDARIFFAGRDVHIVGSLYGGMIFSLKDSKVTEIFLGAASE